MLSQNLLNETLTSIFTLVAVISVTLGYVLLVFLIYQLLLRLAKRKQYKTLDKPREPFRVKLLRAIKRFTRFIAGLPQFYFDFRPEPTLQRKLLFIVGRTALLAFQVFAIFAIWVTIAAAFEGLQKWTSHDYLVAFDVICGFFGFGMLCEHLKTPTLLFCRAILREYKNFLKAGWWYSN